MSGIALIAIGVVALLLVFSLVKKLLKLAFTAGALLLLLAAAFYFLQ